MSDTWLGVVAPTTNTREKIVPRVYSENMLQNMITIVGSIINMIDC